MARAGNPSRLSGLDLLRAVAIAWVMVCHANGFGLLPSDYFGWMGVDLFFVLSGFLIGGQLFAPIARGGRPDYRSFLARRLLRTLPAYLAVLAVYLAFPGLWDRQSLQPALQFFTFTQNLFSVFGFPLLAASMAVLVAAGTEPGSIIGRAPLPGAGALAAASYSLYLSHKIAYRAVIRLTEHAAPQVQALTPLLGSARRSTCSSSGRSSGCGTGFVAS